MADCAASASRHEAYPAFAYLTLENRKRHSRTTTPSLMPGRSHSGPARLPYCDEKAVKLLLDNITRSHENFAQVPPVHHAATLRQCVEAQSGNECLSSYETTRHQSHNIEEVRLAYEAVSNVSMELRICDLELS